MDNLTIAPLSAAQGLTEKLKAKGRARRKGFAHTSLSPFDSSALRNDLSPDLKLVNIAIGDLQV